MLKWLIRCWMFAAFNTMQHEMQIKLRLSENFELSQSYMFFEDKLEKQTIFITTF